MLKPEVVEQQRAAIERVYAVAAKVDLSPMVGAMAKFAKQVADYHYGNRA